MLRVVIAVVAKLLEFALDLIPVLVQGRENDVGGFVPVVFLQDEFGQITFQEAGPRNRQQGLIKVDFGGYHRLGLDDLFGLLFDRQLLDEVAGLFFGLGEENVAPLALDVVGEFLQVIGQVLDDVLADLFGQVAPLVPVAHFAPGRRPLDELGVLGLGDGHPHELVGFGLFHPRHVWLITR